MVAAASSLELASPPLQKPARSRCGGYWVSWPSSMASHIIERTLRNPQGQPHMYSEALPKSLVGTRMGP